MDLKRFETPGVSHYAYLLSDGGEAALIDPSRNVQPYLDAVREQGLRLRYIVETHRQEDFVMGSAELARRSGAKVVNGKHKLFGHGDRRLSDGDEFTVGDVMLRALHTPGHTPESMCYAVYADGPDCAWGVFTGDALFYRDTGRTDLTDASRTAENAALLHDRVNGKLAPLGDTALVLPAHGPGSVCGSGMAERPVSTIGEEKRFNPVFGDRDEFARRKVKERMPRPPFFRTMEKVNLRGGLAPVQRRGDVPMLGLEEFARAARQQPVVDTREPEGYAAGHIPRSLSIWQGGLPVFGGWVAGPETPLYLVTDANGDVDEALAHLGNIGIDSVQGALSGGFGSWRKSGQPVGHSGAITPRTLAAKRGKVQVLDVREEREFAEGHIPGAKNAYVGYLPEKLRTLRLDRGKPVVVTCSVGHRASLAVSLLLRAGFDDVSNLLGGMTAWQALKLPTES